uniref:Uncharacterized protein n=1 Tax=Acrobeloides nanus TaxID=290746 RepID=A0A914BXP4_9BILA
MSRRSDSLPVCSQYEACAVKLSRYPEVSPPPRTTTDQSTSTTTEGSGEGSGEVEGEESTAFPEYDEFVTSIAPFDFNAQPNNVTEKKICKCVDSLATEDEEENSCSFSNPDSIMNIDPTLELSFCKPVTQLFRTKCVGRRGMLRIIGHVHETGEIIDDVQSTAIFCNCETGFRRVGIEPWINGYAFTYQCINPWEHKL